MWGLFRLSQLTLKNLFKNSLYLVAPFKVVDSLYAVNRLRFWHNYMMYIGKGINQQKLGAFKLSTTLCLQIYLIKSIGYILNKAIMMKGAEIPSVRSIYNFYNKINNI